MISRSLVAISRPNPWAAVAGRSSQKSHFAPSSAGHRFLLSACCEHVVEEGVQRWRLVGDGGRDSGEARLTDCAVSVKVSVALGLSSICLICGATAVGWRISALDATLRGLVIELRCMSSLAQNCLSLRFCWVYPSVAAAAGQVVCNDDQRVGSNRTVLSRFGERWLKPLGWYHGACLHGPRPEWIQVMGPANA